MGLTDCDDLPGFVSPELRELEPMRRAARAPRFGSRYSRCVTAEDQVASLDFFVAREAGFERRLIRRFAVFIKLSEPLAASCGVLFWSFTMT